MLKIQLLSARARVRACECVCVRVCACVCMCVLLDSREQINNAVLKTFLSSTNSLHGYFSMKHRAFLTSRLILFTHYKREKARLNYLYVRLAFKSLRLSASIIRHCLCSVLHYEPICLLCQHLREGWQSNQERLK